MVSDLRKVLEFCEQATAGFGYVAESLAVADAYMEVDLVVTRRHLQNALSAAHRLESAAGAWGAHVAAVTRARMCEREAEGQRRLLDV